MKGFAARSISRTVQARLESRRQAAWQVLAVFDHACDLVDPHGNVIAFVLPAIGDGPLNLVIEGNPGTFSALWPEMPVTLRGTQLQVGGIRVDMAQAKIWEPRPEWAHLRSAVKQIQGRLPMLAQLALRHSPGGSLLDSLFEARAWPDSPSPDEFGQAAFQQSLPDLRAGWAGDADRLRRGAAQLAGLGTGLTPAGDDFLAGLMLRAWLEHPNPRSVCCELVQAAAPRTTTLSAALLRAAAHGECNVAWHGLFDTLDAGGENLSSKVKDVLSYGHTSGADALAGFLLQGSLNE